MASGMLSLSTKIRLSAGTKDSWATDAHDFQVAARGKFLKPTHDGFDIQEFLNRADPELVKKRTKFRKDHPEHVEASSDVAYEVLNTMFKPGSPAHLLIRSKASSGEISIGKGWHLYECLFLWATRGKSATRGTAKKVKELSSFMMGANEDADTNLRPTISCGDFGTKRKGSTTGISRGPADAVDRHRSSGSVRKIG